MPKLYSARVLITALKRAGYLVVSQKGSHIKLVKKSREEVFTVIVPNHKEIASGTFQSILRQAGITKEELEKFIR